jgi:hypothetical protein
MYIIKNITTYDITIPDLRITLTPDEKIDLDMVTSRYYIDQSSTLRGLFRANKLQCIIKDTGINTYEVHRQEYQPIIESPKPEANQQDVIDAVKKLEEKLAKRLDEKMQNSQPQIDMNAINQVLQTLQNLVGNNQQVASKPIETNAKDIDDKKMVDIQKRTVNRLVNKTESSVKHDEQMSDRNINRNASELEDLL